MAQEQLQAAEQAGGSGSFDAPIPGASLTNAKEAPQPYETAPDMNSAEEVVANLWERIRDDESVLDGVLDNMRDGLPLEDIAQVLLFEGFSQGKFNPDVVLNAIEPTIYLLAFLANWAEIPAEIYPEEEFDAPESDEAMSKVLEAMETQEIEGEVTVGGETLKRPSAIPDSLLSTDQLPQKEGEA
ncbi:MAG: hypothetical protein V3S69_05100 [Dehalococcoidales bacterium]